MEEQVKKKCTTCGAKKLIEEFEKIHKGKYGSRCKECANKYQKGRKLKETEEESKMSIPPIFEDKQKKTKVQRKQMVILQGEIDGFVKMTCPCGLGIDLEYQHSYDQKNDYYEAACAICGKTFKLNVVSK